MRLRRVILLVAGSLAVIVAAALAYLVWVEHVTAPMLKDYGYYRWAHGRAPYQPECLLTFTRDDRFQQQFVGKPIDSMRPLFPGLHSGAGYDPGSYRGTTRRYYICRYTGTRFEDYWFDGTENDSGFCALVVDGKIRDFFYVKG